MNTADQIRITDGEESFECSWGGFVEANKDGWFYERPQDIQAVERVLDNGWTYADGGGASSTFTIRAVAVRELADGDKVVQR